MRLILFPLSSGPSLLDGPPCVRASRTLCFTRFQLIVNGRSLCAGNSHRHPFFGRAPAGNTVSIFSGANFSARAPHGTDRHSGAMLAIWVARRVDIIRLPPNAAENFFYPPLSPINASLLRAVRAALIGRGEPAHGVPRQLGFPVIHVKRTATALDSTSPFTQGEPHRHALSNNSNSLSFLKEPVGWPEWTKFGPGRGWLTTNERENRLWFYAVRSWGPLAVACGRDSQLTGDLTMSLRYDPSGGNQEGWFLF